MPTTKPVVYITADAWHKIRGYVMASKLECSMLCEVSSDNNRFVIDAVHLPEQTRSACYTKITHAGVASILTNKDVNPLKVKCWVHSHVNMQPTPSATDENQAKELMEDAEWFIRMIVNKKDNYTLFIHWHGIDIECDLEILGDEEFNIEELEKELDAVTVVAPIIEAKHQFVTYGANQQTSFFKNDEYVSSETNIYNPRTLITYKEHLSQNPHISVPVHNKYVMTYAARPYLAWFNAIKKRIPKGMGKKFLAQVYEEYLDNLTEGIYEGYCLELSIGEIRA